MAHIRTDVDHEGSAVYMQRREHRSLIEQSISCIACTLDLCRLTAALVGVCAGTRRQAGVGVEDEGRKLAYPVYSRV